jgi:hypothetical protein
MQPKRIQRRRVKGWKMPENTIYVGRGTKWGNPHKVGISLAKNSDGTYRYMTTDDAVKAYHETIMFYINKGELNPEELRGKNLSCWCKEGDKCHADVLLEIANS